MVSTSFQNFKIISKGGKTQCYLDDKKIHTVLSCTIKAEVGNPTKVTLEFYADVESGVEVKT
jgi:hypothetical protein